MGRRPFQDAEISSVDILWINGEYMPLNEGRVSMEERGLLFGEGIYEVIAAYDGAPILMDEHLDRWERSAKGIHLEPKYTREEREEVLHELIRRMGHPRVTLYGQLTRGAARRNHAFPKKTEPLEFWFVRELPPYPDTMFADGVSAVTHPDERWARCWIKATNLLANVLAKQYAAERGAFESILVREDGTVTEASVANFHMVKDGIVYTHPDDGRILAGCKRHMVLQLARDADIQVREERYTIDFLRKADEGFLTSTTINVLPVTKLDTAPIGTGRVGATTRRLMDLTQAEVTRRKLQNTPVTT